MQVRCEDYQKTIKSAHHVQLLPLPNTPRYRKPLIAQEEAEALVAEIDAAGLVRVGACQATPESPRLSVTPARPPA